MSHIRASVAGRTAFALLAATVLCSAAAGQERQGTLIKKGPSPADGGLATTDLNTLTLADVVTALVGPGVVVSNITYQGVDESAGTFVGGTGIVGFESGVILSSGSISNTVGPNLFDNVTFATFAPGDADLDALIPGFTTFDATILEFDLECPGGSEISFQYVFSSDEYNEFVFTAFNDPFAFYLNGANIAEVPGPPGTPVTIDTVNCGNPFNPPLGGVNCGLFVNNDLNDGGPFVNTEMDGLTTLFSATGTLAPGTNHIKLAIADAGDRAYDSNVFLRGESFICEAPAPVFDPPSPCGETLTVAVGAPLSYSVVALATNGLPGQFVTLTASGVPAGANHAPALPVVGQPATSSFSWTPTAGDLGTHVVTYTATDQLKQTATCSVEIEVVLCSNQASVEDVGSPCPSSLSMSSAATGTTAVITYDGVAAGAPGAIYFSPPGAPPTPFAGCTVYLNLASAGFVSAFTTDGNGDVQFSVPLTYDNPSRCGKQWLLQAFSIDLATLGIEISNAVLLTFGV